MSERTTELKRRHHRKLKMRKLKAKLAKAGTEQDKAAITRKMHILSPAFKIPTAAAPAKK